jgi:hypothetical protein
MKSPGHSEMMPPTDSDMMSPRTRVPRWLLICDIVYCGRSIFFGKLCAGAPEALA